LTKRAEGASHSKVPEAAGLIWVRRNDVISKSPRSIEVTDPERTERSKEARSYLLSDCEAENGKVAKRSRPRRKKISKTEQNVALARRTIIEAARDLFVERGFHHTSVDDIAARAGVSRATCYYQFKSKNGLLDAVVADAQDRAPVTLRSKIRHPATQPRPADNLRSLIRDICLIWEQDRLFSGG
jgi:hypothetical protein